MTEEASNLTAAVKQTAAGILGTTVQMADLVRLFSWHAILIAARGPSQSNANN